MSCHYKLLGFLIIGFIFGAHVPGFCEENERITVEVNGRPKQYDVIETKRYEIVEVEGSAVTPDALESVAEQAVKDAEKDAVVHLNRTLWFSTGCFFPLVGPIFSQRYQPFMPTARVLGKSPQYVAFYYDAYKVKTKKIQFSWALGGCLVGAPIGGYLLTVLYRATRD
ncbi:hypothetical protein C6499_17700 [Candidatus Poribacteria bacterium]|nr:MAG: hypothetical protein C6499_17700 [Candidatus Poribacteria bacterium]